MKTDFQGITYNQVKSILQEVADQVPAIDTVCSEFTMSSSMTGDVFLRAKVNKINIELSVRYEGGKSAGK